MTLFALRDPKENQMNVSNEKIKLEEIIVHVELMLRKATKMWRTERAEPTLIEGRIVRATTVLNVKTVMSGVMLIVVGS